MSSVIPTGKTYLGFILLWNAVFCAAGVACLVLVAAGYIVTAISLLLLTAYGPFRHAKSIGERAKLGIRRPTPTAASGPDANPDSHD